MLICISLPFSLTVCPSPFLSVFHHCCYQMIQLLKRSVWILRTSGSGFVSTKPVLTGIKRIKNHKMTPAPGPQSQAQLASAFAQPETERRPQAFFTNGPLKLPVSMTKERAVPWSAKEAVQWSGCALPLLIFMETNSITLGSDIVLNSNMEPVFLCWAQGVILII